MCCGYLINQACCCAGQCCCGIICFPCKVCGAHKKTLSKIGYICFSFFWVFVAFILLYTAKEVFDYWRSYLNCPSGGSSCLGSSAIYRISFVLMLFHILILIIIAPRIPCSAYFHDGCWITKFFLVLAAFILSFWIPNDFFKSIYGYFSLVCSFFFLIFQGIVFMGACYSINDHLISQSDQNKGYLICLLVTTGIITAISLLFIILEYVWFYDCWSNNIFIIIPVLFTIGYVVLVVLRTRPNGSLFTTSVILLYLVYLTWTALASRPDSSCNPFYQKDFGTVLQIVFGLFFTFLALIILASGTKSDKKSPEAQFKNVAAEDKDDNNEIEQQDHKGDKVESHVFPISVATIIFHAFMVFVSIYYCMLISNWGRPTVREDDYDYFIDKWAGFWVKIVGQWVLCLLYLLSLLAPLIFRNREF